MGIAFGHAGQFEQFAQSFLPSSDRRVQRGLPVQNKYRALTGSGFQSFGDKIRQDAIHWHTGFSRVEEDFVSRFFVVTK
jgi:hypothetical protein